MTEINDKVIDFSKAKKRLEKVFDSKDRRVQYFWRSRYTDRYVYRRKFDKLGIPELKITLESKTLGAAKTEAEIEVQKWKNKHLGIDDTRVFARRVEKTFREIREEMKTKYKPKNKTGFLREGSKELHNFYLDELTEHFGSRDPNAITEEDFDDFILGYRIHTPERKTFGDFAKFMNIFMKYAYQKKYVKHRISFRNPDSGLVHKKRKFTAQEIEALWNAFDDDMKDLLSCIYQSMMRKHMALELEWSRLDLKTGRVEFRPEHLKTGSRTGKGQVKLLNPTTLKRMRARWQRMKHLQSPWVFPMKTLHWNGAKAGVPRVSQKPQKWIYYPDRHQGDFKSAWASAKTKAGITGRAPWKDFRHTALTEALLVLKLNPVQTTQYAGNSMRTAEKDYLQHSEEHTKEISEALSIGKAGKPR